jgi:flagellar protein FliS
MNPNLAAQTTAYLKTKVMTARPEELRLMLFDGAIKFCRQARHALPQKDFESSFNSLTKAKNILLELQTSLNHQIDPDLCSKLGSLYNYMYLRLVDANLERDELAIDEVIGLLEYERETWVLLMKKVQSQRDAEGSAPGAEGSTAAAAPVASPVASGYAPRNPLAKLGSGAAPSAASPSRLIAEG